MRVETWLFASGVFFFTPIAVVYGLLTEWREPVGATALFLTAGLAAMIGAYLAVTARRIDARPEDDLEGEIHEGAGEMGFFSPHSWWPLPVAAAAAIAFLGLAVGWWLFLIGVGLGVVSIIGLYYEYYRAEHVRYRP